MDKHSTQSGKTNLLQVCNVRDHPQTNNNYMVLLVDTKLCMGYISLDVIQGMGYFSHGDMSLVGKSLGTVFFSLAASEHRADQ